MRFFFSLMLFLLVFNNKTLKTGDLLKNSIIFYNNNSQIPVNKSGIWIAPHFDKLIRNLEKDDFSFNLVKISSNLARIQDTIMLYHYLVERKVFVSITKLWKVENKKENECIWLIFLLQLISISLQAIFWLF